MTIFQSIILWLFVSLCLGQLILSVRAWRLERRSGLVPSRARLVWIALIFLSNSALMVAATSIEPSARRPGEQAADPGAKPAPNRVDIAETAEAPGGKSTPPRVSPGPDETKGEAESRGPARSDTARADAGQKQSRAAALMARRGEIERQISTLKHELQCIEDELNQARPCAAAPGTTETPRPPEPPRSPSTAPPPVLEQKKTESASRPESVQRGDWRAAFLDLVLILVPMLTALGFVLLFLLGDSSTVIPKRWRGRGPRVDRDPRARAEADLDALTLAAQTGRYEDGLASADRINLQLLDTLEQMDWVFLRCYCAVQFATGEPGASLDKKRRDELLNTAIQALERLLEQAPNHAEARYLLAVARAGMADYEAALAAFEAAQALMADFDLPFADNQSVCLLELAERCLKGGDGSAAAALFDRVTELGTMRDRIPSTLVKVRLLNVRRDLSRDKITEVEEGIRALRSLEGLGSDDRRAVHLLCDIVETLIPVRRSDARQTLERVRAFLARYLPDKLPEPTEEIADEYLESAIAEKDLPVPASVFRAFLFLEAVSQVRLMAGNGTPPTPAQAQELARPLLRALQFELRHRDVLAALGGLYYWFLPPRRRKAIEWLEAAVTMGVRSKIVTELLEYDRLHELERQETLDLFRAASTRYLRDPALKREIRKALVEELGRFQEFQPIVLELQQHINEIQSQPVTLELLLERARYLEGMAANVADRSSDSGTSTLPSLCKQYSQLIDSLAAMTSQIEQLEGRLLATVGKTVMI